MNRKLKFTVFIVGVAFGCLLTGCGRSAEDDIKIASTPQEAASQIEQAFASSNDTTKQAANAVSEAMRKGEYEKAVVSLQTIRANENVTLDQGLAVHSSTVVLEKRLIDAIEAGDKNAERAYQLLKAMKRK